MGLSGEYERAPAARDWSFRPSFGQLAGWLVRNVVAELERWPLFLPVAMGVGIGIFFWLHREPPLWLAIW